MAELLEYDSFLDEIGSAEVEVDQWQLEKLALAGQKNELFFYLPGVANDKLGNLASRCFPDPGRQQWLRFSMASHPAPGWRWFRKAPTYTPGFRKDRERAGLVVNYHQCQMAKCESGEIGRRTRLRIWRGNPWGFESPLSHQQLRIDPINLAPATVPNF